MSRMIAISFLAFSTLAAAAPPAWMPDPTFGTGGASTLEIDPGANDQDYALVSVSDAQKRLYLIGIATNNNNGCLAITRFLPDGELDSANYGDGGKRCLGSLFEGGGILYPTDALMQADDKLVVAGYNDGSSRWPVICRFDTTGQLDTENFGPTTTPGCTVFEDIEVEGGWPAGAPYETRLRAVSIAADTDMLRVAMTADSELASIHMARLSLDGHIVPFGQSATFPLLTDGDHYLSDILLAHDGMLIVTGAVSLDDWDVFLTVVDSNSGEQDNTFNGGKVLTYAANEGVRDVPTSLALTLEGNIVIGGASGVEMRPAIAVVNREGQFLPGFHNGQPATYNPCVFHLGDCEIYVTDVEALPNGKILLGGYALQDGFYRAYTMRLESDGTPDASYGPNFPGQQGYAPLMHDQSQVATSMLLQDGRTVLAGWRDVGGPNGKDFFVTRLSDGSLFRDGFEEVP